MTNDPTENIVSALSNISQGSILIHQWNDYVAGETTRIMNIYAGFIGTDSEGDNYKEIYLKAKSVIDKCDEIEDRTEELKDIILNLLNTIGGLDEEEQE